jgi:hypothetical protein
MRAVLLALGLCVLNGLAQAQEGVLYCSEDLSTGMAWNGTTYALTEFNPRRFTLKFEGDEALVTSNGNFVRMSCVKTIFDKRQQGWTCSESLGSTLSYNLNDGAFARSSVFGAAFDRGRARRDTTTVAVGTCSAF